MFPFRPAAERAGFARDALYLVRPDGYVALADPSGRPAALERYLESCGLRLARRPSGVAPDDPEPPTHPPQPGAQA